METSFKPTDKIQSEYFKPDFVEEYKKTCVKRKCTNKQLKD